MLPAFIRDPGKEEQKPGDILYIQSFSQKQNNSFYYSVMRTHMLVTYILQNMERRFFVCVFLHHLFRGEHKQSL